MLNMNFLRYDLILLDIMMPGLNGYEVCSQIRNRSGLSYYIFNCQNTKETDIIRGLGLGADDYITKRSTGI